ncbi:MAG TPA: YtxH domain-containing protein [Anaerolineales bacterium]|nr:YtxH domain-containing protein [Anaerolineales bacterium]
MRRMMSFLTGVIFGAVVGAVTALLLAPASGEELRSQARERIDDLTDEVREAYSARVSQLEAELEKLRSRAKA